jgi:hypothetical protein
MKGETQKIYIALLAFYKSTIIPDQIRQNHPGLTLKKAG